PPKERFDRVIVDKKIEGREAHLKSLHKVIRNVRSMDQEVDQRFHQWRAGSKERQNKLFDEFKLADKKLQAGFTKFYFKHKVIEEMVVVAGNIQDKIRVSLRQIDECEKQRKSPALQAIVESEQQK